MRRNKLQTWRARFAASLQSCMTAALVGWRHSREAKVINECDLLPETVARGQNISESKQCSTQQAAADAASGQSHAATLTGGRGSGALAWIVSAGERRKQHVQQRADRSRRGPKCTGTRPPAAKPGGGRHAQQLQAGAPR